MIFNIPQFIDKEDKIVGPLTAKQLGWLFLGGSVVLVLWNLLDTQTFYLSAVPVVGIFIAFAFYRPYNQTLLNFIISIIFFMLHNKIYIWKRLPEENIPIKKAPTPTKLISHDEKINSKNLGEISKLLDNKK